MKKIKILLAVVLGTGLLASCSDDDAGPAVSGDLNGRWNPSKTTVKVGTETFTQNYTLNEEGCDKDYLEFAGANVLKFAVSNRNPDTNACEEAVGTPNTWARDENTLTIVGGQYDGTYEITKLNNSELRIQDESTSAGVTTTTTVFFTSAD